MWNVQLEKSIRATTAAEQQKNDKNKCEMAKWKFHTPNFHADFHPSNTSHWSLSAHRRASVDVFVVRFEIHCPCFFLFLLNSVRRNLFLRFWWEKRTSSLMQAHSIGRQSIMVVNNWRDSPIRHFDDLIISIFHSSVISLLYNKLPTTRTETGAYTNLFCAVCKHRQGRENSKFDCALEFE